METNNLIFAEVIKKGGERYIKEVSHEEYHILQKDENIIEIKPCSAKDIKERERQYDAVTSGWAF